MLLQIPDEEALLGLNERANGTPRSLFREPDVDDEATALAIAPSGRKLISNLPLLLKA